MSSDFNKITGPSLPQSSNGGSGVPLSAQSAAIATSSSTPVTSGKLVGGAAEFTEREIIDKAKTIIEATREDPYRQADEIAKFKTEYMKNHYNKVLKIE